MDDPLLPLRRGWTTGACATAATKAALMRLWGGRFPNTVRITLPRGEMPEFTLTHADHGPNWAEAGIIKDAGDDPDVTHDALIIARVSQGTHGVRFHAGQGVGMVTRAGLPIPVGEPAINPVPRQMMTDVVQNLATQYGQPPHVDITISIPNGGELAAKTWNPRLGITGGLSILGTTGIVRPFSCAAWIASIHRGVDVARADGLTHVAGCTGATSEQVVQDLFDLPDHAMLDMGDFAGGLMKYIARNPVPRLTIGGGIGKLTKLAQGARDLHSRRSQVDFDALATVLNHPDVAQANTVLEAYEMVGKPLTDWVVTQAQAHCQEMLPKTQIDVIAIDRAGQILGRTS